MCTPACLAKKSGARKAIPSTVIRGARSTFGTKSTFGKSSAKITFGAKKR